MHGDSTDLLLPELKRNQEYNENSHEDKNLALQTRKLHEYNKNLYDENRLDYKFKKGDVVYVASKNKLKRRKLDEIRVGPFKIGEKIPDSIDKINIGYKKSSMGLYHVTKLISVEHSV